MDRLLGQVCDDCKTQDIFSNRLANAVLISFVAVASALLFSLLRTYWGRGAYGVISDNSFGQ